MEILATCMLSVLSACSYLLPVSFFLPFMLSKKEKGILFLIFLVSILLIQWKLGNILTDSFEEMKQGRKWQAFIAWSEQIPEECQACPWFALCRNGCRRNREPVTESSARKNLYCSAYRNFLEYAYPRLTELYWMRQLDPGRFQ